MGTPAAKFNDQVIGVDLHLVVVPPSPVPLLLPHPFNGLISGNLSTNVMFMGKPAATLGSTALNNPPHIPQGASFVRPPTNMATIIKGSATVFINGKPAARLGDSAVTCNDPSDLPTGTVQATGTVLIG